MRNQVAILVNCQTVHDFINEVQRDRVATFFCWDRDGRRECCGHQKRVTWCIVMEAGSSLSHAWITKRNWRLVSGRAKDCCLGRTGLRMKREMMVFIGNFRKGWNTVSYFRGLKT